MKLSKVALVGLLAVSVGFAADFSKKSDEEVTKLHGTLKGADAVDLQFEIMKRLKALEGEARMKFAEKIKASFEKNTENMKVKDFRAYEKSIKEGVKAKIEKLSDAEKEKLGFGGEGHSCPHHGGDDKAQGGHEHKH